MPVREGIYGLLAEFDTPTELVVAAKTAYDEGWRRMDCYTPYPVEEAAEAIGFHRNYVPLVCLVGGLMGLAAMFLGIGPGLSAEHRWTSAVFLAGLHYPCLRVDHSLGRSFCCVWHAGLVRSAPALSPTLQRAEFPQWSDGG
jgi:hypothetical protein